MKQTLTLAVLGAVYGLSALIDAPIVVQAFIFCVNSLVPYEGTGWFAASAGAFAAVLLGTAFWRSVCCAPWTPPIRADVESITPPNRFDPYLIAPIAYGIDPSDAIGAGVPPIDLGSE